MSLEWRYKNSLTGKRWSVWVDVDKDGPFFEKGELEALNLLLSRGGRTKITMHGPSSKAQYRVRYGGCG